MNRENLLIDCNIKSVRQRLETTLSNIQYQKSLMYWDDEEKIEHCIEVLKILEQETTPIISLQHQLFNKITEKI